MKFNSWEFLLFLPLVLSIYYLLPHRWQNRFLLAASYYFYGFWDWRFLSLILISTFVDYTAGLRIYRSNKSAVRKFYLWLSVAVNLGILGTFKYFDFFIDSFEAILAPLGFGPVGFRTLNLVLPVGISFYTFQTMSYTIDIYRRQFVPTRDFIDFSLFVAFFPQLVSGPIERAVNLLPQIQKPRVITTEMLQIGLLLLAIGYVKKVLIADNLGMYVDYCYANYPDMSSLGCLQGMYYFYFQIYCDFSAYSDIALGIGYLLGIRLMINFRQPVFSASFREFWKRFHISLSRWLRDYVYIPLGGGRGNLSRVARNILVTMALCGLWHGASWNFVLWGCLLGFAQVVEAWIRRIRRAPQSTKALNPARLLTYKLIRILVIFHVCVLLGGLLFRTPDLETAKLFAFQTFSPQTGELLSPWGFVLILLTLCIDLPQYLADNLTVFLRLPRVFLFVAGAIVIFLFLRFGSVQELPFIYFQF